MFRSTRKQWAFLWFGVMCLLMVLVKAQSGGVVEGTTRLDRTGEPIHGVAVLIVQLGLTVEADTSGHFRFENVPAGNYDILAQSGVLSTPIQLIEVRPDEVTTVDFSLKLEPIRHEITVTARGQEETAFEAVQSVTTLDSFDLAQKMSSSLGDVLDDEPGVSKRSFGPGSTRPVIRGFDGDRVLVMQDGIRVGSLASQSGDHGEPLDSASVQRVEIIKGPATLLYGSNAIGGVVNAVSGHNEAHQRPHQGLTGQLTTGAGANNGYGSASIKVEYGHRGWFSWAGGGGRRSGDYTTPMGLVDNSKSRMTNISAGLGYFGNKAYLSFGATLNDGLYGIPGAHEFHGLHGHGEEEEGHHDDDEEEEDHGEEELEGINVDFRRTNYRFAAGVQNLNRGIQRFDFSLNYSDWNHNELELLASGEKEAATRFDNQQWVYRGVFEQQRTGNVGGRFGFWGRVRNYEVVGEESLSPPVDQQAFALFALEELDFEAVKLQFGVRAEFTDYKVKGLQLREHHHEEEEHEEGEMEEEIESIQLPGRDFVAVSAGIGARFEVGTHGAFIANFTSSHRAPALEELYNFGPHVGNLAFEVGNPQLEAERSNGLDFSFRHHHERLHVNASFFYYGIDNFIFLQPSGEVVGGLLEGDYQQGDSRFVGAEFRVDSSLHENLWLNLGLDLVDAKLTHLNQPLPRIPPIKGRIGLDFRHHGFSFRPQLVMAGRQDQLSPMETPTAGYTVLDLKASYTIPSRHFLHQFAVNVYNVGDRLYRNHLSFIKELAPEIGRGIRVSYTVKFF